MGFFGGNDSENDADSLMDEQIRLNKAQLAEQRDAFFKTRMSIMKSSGAQMFEPDKSTIPRSLGIPGKKPENN